MRNNHRKINLYTQGQRLAARVLFIVGLLVSFGLGKVLAAPGDQGNQEGGSISEISVYGTEAWKQCFKQASDLALPENIQATLNAPCPFWNSKQIKDTHLLALIPKFVAVEHLTLHSLMQQIHTSKGEIGGSQYPIKFDVSSISSKALKDQNMANPYWALVATHPRNSYWVLMTKDPLPNTINMSYKDQCAKMTEYNNTTGLLYEIPSVLEATAVMLLHYVKNGKSLCEKREMNTKCRDINNGSVTVCGCCDPEDITIAITEPLPNLAGVFGLRKL